MTMRIAALLLLVSTTAISTAAISTAAISTAALAAPGSSSGHGNGGLFKDFDPIVKEYSQSGEPFRIEGHCQSACTLFLRIRNVCIEPSASLLFHAGHDRQKNITAQATNHMLGAYNGKLRAYLVANHAMETLEFTTISGADMIKKFGYRACKG